MWQSGLSADASMMVIAHMSLSVNFIGNITPASHVLEERCLYLIPMGHLPRVGITFEMDLIGYSKTDFWSSTGDSSYTA